MNGTEKEVYVVDNALQVVDKKKNKGRLYIYIYKWMFLGKERTSCEYDICEITVSPTVLSVPGLFGSRNTPALRISVPGKKDGVFAMPEGSIWDAIKKIRAAAEAENIRRKEEQYNSACKSMNQIRTSDDAKTVANQFKRMSTYKDASQRAQECAKLTLDLSEKEEAYDDVARLLSSHCDITAIDKAIDVLKSLAGYRDTSHLLTTATTKRNELVEKLYADACKKLGQVRTPEAAKAVLSLFLQIPDYKDTSNQIKRCNQLISEFERQDAISRKAIAILEKATTIAEVDEAAGLFGMIINYFQAKSWIDKCACMKASLQEQIYVEAVRKLAAASIPADVDPVIKLLKSIEGYRDVSCKIDECQETKKKIEAKEVIYKNARSRLDEAKSINEYEAVEKLLDSIAGYRDAQKLSDTCNSKIQELKEIEEELKKEAARKARLEAEKKAEIEEIEQAQSTPDNLDITKAKCISLNRKALNFFLENPFRILGLSRNASAEDAQVVMDKFKKLERLKALGSYSSSFHLKHFSKPDRSAAVIQAAIGTLADIRNRILWFATPIGSMAWNAPAYRELSCKLPGVDFDQYDIFLANYLYALLNDPSFADAALWERVFKQMSSFIKQGDNMAALFAEAEKEGDFGVVFEKQVSGPITALIEDSDITGLKNLFLIINGMDDLNTIPKKLDSRLSKWFETETRTIDREISDLGEGKDASSDKVTKAKNLYAQLESTVKPELVWAEKNYSAKSVRLTMFQDEYRGTAWSLMAFLFQADSKSDAREIADDIEKYCNDEQKELIKYVIREIPRPRPRPVPPEHEYYDLGFVFIGFSEIKFVEVTLNFAANVYLMDSSDLDDYMHCRRFSYYGGRATQSPYRIKIPSSGTWHLVIDDAPGSLGGIRSSVRVRTISNSYY